MTLEQARASCNDPFEQMFLWNIIQPLHPVDVNHHSYWMHWILVNPENLQRIYINTGSGDSEPFDAFYAKGYVEDQIEVLLGQAWATVALENIPPAYKDKWCCGTRADLAAWLCQQLDTKRCKR